MTESDESHLHLLHEPSDDPDDLSAHGEARRRFLIESGVITSTVVASPYVSAALPAAGETPRPLRVRLDINGQLHALEIDPRTTLLDALRERIGLTGTKKGCDRGQCGACTVIVNGRRVNSCLTLAAAVDGDRITTIEGLARGGRLHPVQQAFLERDAFQCGYCTSGQICSAVALLDEARTGTASAVTRDVRSATGPELTVEEIRERMSGNICRCGAYVNIVAAVQDAVVRGK